MTYLVEVIIHEGEHVHTTYALTSFIPDQTFIDQKFGYGDGYASIKTFLVNEISESDAEVLKRLNIAHHYAKTEESEAKAERKDYTDMTEEELAQVKGRFKVGNSPDEFGCLLDAIKMAEGIAHSKHIEVWVWECFGDDEWDDICWEVDGREGA